MNTPLSSFTALVKFQFDRAGLTSEIARVRSQLQSLTNTQDRQARTQERSTRQREQSAARSFVSEMRLQRLHSRALRENEAFDLRRQATQRTLERNREAQQLREQRSRDRDAAIQMRNMRQLADFQNREYDRTQRNRRRIEQQSQRDATRLHTEALRENARRDADLQRRLRQNSPRNTPTNNQGGNANPWHIGTMAGGLGGLITRGNLAAVGAGAGLQQMYTTANFTAARAPIYEFLTGTKEGGAKQIKYVNDLVDELHLDLIATDKSYTQFLGAVNSSIGADKAQKTFKTIQSFGVMMGASPEALGRGTKAIQQMLSKQKLSAEELECRLAA